ncbi:hypothetical protein DPMN_172107 [Dreissena polymorpha]|uniref:Uncharacterized protein n=1 Tax=Dreissena polymorpha TaxID=45954 RepID=A0A9D4IFR7_DREPO|nr:hypothetical protein DPMN_172107 [Dreissena polymorpha]
MVETLSGNVWKSSVNEAVDAHVVPTDLNTSRTNANAMNATLPLSVGTYVKDPDVQRDHAYRQNIVWLNTIYVLNNSLFRF